MTIANIKETLLQEVNILPPVHCSEVLGFIETLKTGRQPMAQETMLLSESALAKNWDTEEEDNAWASL